MIVKLAPTELLNMLNLLKSQRTVSSGNDARYTKKTMALMKLHFVTAYIKMKVEHIQRSSGTGLIWWVLISPLSAFYIWWSPYHVSPTLVLHFNTLHPFSFLFFYSVLLSSSLHVQNFSPSLSYSVLISVSIAIYFTFSPSFLLPLVSPSEGRL